MDALRLRHERPGLFFPHARKRAAPGRGEGRSLVCHKCENSLQESARLLLIQLRLAMPVDRAFQLNFT